MNWARFTLLFSFILSSNSVSAQNAFVSAGRDFYRPTGNMSLSIGQVFYVHNYSNNGIEAQGVQQPYTISIVYSEPEYNFTIYPNPVQNNLIIDIGNFQGNSLSYQVLSVHGQIIFEGNILSIKTFIDMSFLSRTNYFVVVKDTVRNLKVFKVIKN